MSRRLHRVGAVLVATTVTGLAVAYTVGEGGAGEAPAPAVADVPTAAVKREDLVTTETVEGTLGYADQARVAGNVGGTITRLPAEGAVVSRGEALYAVDGRSVFLLYGTVPAYRTMTTGSEGADVLQLERNLRALGYGEDLRVDGTYTDYTASAVREWQDDHDLPETGDVALGSVVFRSGPVRVAGHETAVGARTAPGQPVITASALRRVVTVDLPVQQRPLAKRSAPVQVTLPDGRTVSGRVSSVGRVVQTTGGEQGEEEETTVEVEITLDRPSAAGRLDFAPVEATFESERREDVLSVPLNALVALPDGGYAVKVVEHGRSRAVAVALGVFASGRVEVSGSGLEAGTRVEVPAS